VAFPHSGNDECLNFDNEVELFQPGTHGNRQVPIIQYSDYSTIRTLTKVLTDIFCYCSYNIGLFNNNNKSIHFVYLLVV